MHPGGGVLRRRVRRRGRLSTDAGRGYLGEAVELRYRLPRLWQRLRGGDLQAWKARRIARATILLSREAAAFVDAHVAHVAHRIGPYQLDRLVEEAIARFMPDEAENAAGPPPTDDGSTSTPATPP